MKVKFKFNIDDSVLTPFNEKGIITMAAIDPSKVYYVKTKKKSYWIKETLLKTYKN